MKNTPNTKRANGRVVTALPALLAAGFILAMAAAGLVLNACDMTFINPLGGRTAGGSTDDDSDRGALEKDGHFLKIINLPYDTQVTNISAVSAANAVSAIAQRADNAELKIFHDLTNATAYVPLAYSGGGDFVENGTLYVSFTVDVDALTRIVVRIDDRVLVRFTDGRGEIDIRQLPAHLLPDDPLSAEQERVEREEHYLKLINLPRNTSIKNIGAATVLNAAGTAGRDSGDEPVKIFKNALNATAYIPLVYPDDSPFLEDGQFYVAFAVEVDALTRVIVQAKDNILVPFSEGRGELDILSLPPGLISGGDDPFNPYTPPYVDDDVRDLIEREGRYLKLLNLPYNTQTTSFAQIQIANNAAAVAQCPDLSRIKLFREPASVTAYIPLLYNSGGDFIETGSFYAIVSANIDALTWIAVSRDSLVLVDFIDGRGTLDIRSLSPGDTVSPNWPTPGGDGDPFSPYTPPYVDDDVLDLIERDGRYLKLVNLPYNTQTTSFAHIQIANSAAVIAQCPDLSRIKLHREPASVTAYIPLVYNNGGGFIETGPFYVIVSVNIDALTWIAVSRDSLVLVDFIDGRGTLDVLSLRPGETISPNWPVTEDEQQQELERSGRYLKLLNMPFNTLAANVKSCAVADSHNDVARLDSTAGVAVFKQTSTANVYINLVNTDGSEFLVNGPFFVTLSVFIDANTWIEISRNAAVTVDFVNGQGTLDVLSLRPGDTISPDWPVTEPEPGTGGNPSTEDIAEMERNGHYLRLYHIPAGTRPEFVSGLSVSDGSSAVAAADQHTSAIVVQDGSFSNAYLPLVSSNGGSFTRTGAFFAAFSIRVDALTAIAVSLQDNVIVNFDTGRGELDIEHLIREHPDVITQIPDPVVEEEIDAIINAGGYVRFHNLPYNASKYSFTQVSVDDDLSAVAKPADYDAVAVRKSGLTAEAFVPVNFVRGGLPFSETGLFIISFTINISVGNRIIVLPSYLPRPLYQFQDGAASVDVSFLPHPPVLPPIITHCLTIGGLPADTSPAVFANVFVHNAAGVTAKCPDYNRIYTAPLGGASYAVIPLVYDNNQSYNDKDFAETGNFIVTFAAYPDADHVIIVTPDNNCRAGFSNGSALLDVSDIPPVPRRTLSITGLPANTQATNVSDVFVYNQAGEVAQCPDYALVQAVSAYDDSVTLRVPLVYSAGQSKDRMFVESGPFYVSFDVNPDALTRFLLVEADRISANFSDGNGSFNVANIPQPPPVPYLTIVGLPNNIAPGNFSNVFLYNAAGKVARQADPNDYSILISRNGDSATAMIPLVYNDGSREFFLDSGPFIVSFTAHIDANTAVIKEQADALTVSFINGSGTLDVAGDRGFASVSLTNPGDSNFAPPIIKAGSVFEMNGSYERVAANTGVQAASFSTTRLVYVYAVKNAGNLSFVYSTTAPTWNASKNAWYNGDNRALFKLLFIRDTEDKFAAKTYIADDFTPFKYYTLDNANYTTQSRNPVYSLDGLYNSPSLSYTPAEGWYLIELTGAGGGGGSGLYNTGRYGGKAGNGGYVAELVYLPNSALTVYAGSGGSGAGSYMNSSDCSSQGTGGGGGGAGSFVFSLDNYLLCAGGGGGGGGIGPKGGGGGGGAGGSVGGGGGGGGGGCNNDRDGSWGGIGGGAGAGTFGAGGSRVVGYPGGDAASSLPLPVSFGFNGAFGQRTPSSSANPSGAATNNPADGGDGGKAAHVDSAPGIWNYTNGANGSGGNGGSNSDGNPGGDGGNNRNDIRGNGAAGGDGGLPSASQSAFGVTGAPGSVKFYHIGG
jgi:hypothetical protein